MSESEGSGNWLGNLINAYIFTIIGGIVNQVQILFVILGTPGWGYEFMMDYTDMLPEKAESYTLTFNWMKKNWNNWNRKICFRVETSITKVIYG